MADAAKAAAPKVSPPAADFPKIDPENVPAEASPEVAPESKGDELLASAQAKAPNLTREFVDKYELSDEMVAAIARGEVPPPPYNGPDFSATDLHLTPGGWQVTPKGVKPEDVGANKISR